MMYSIQNAGGEVYGFFELPEVGMSAEVWATELEVDLHDILGINGVCDSALSTPDGEGGYNKVPKVVIDIDAYSGSEEEKVQRVHQTVTAIALQHLKPQA